MEALEGLIEALAPDHVQHIGREFTTAGKDVQVKCGCGVRLTFLAAQISAITRPPQTTSSPKTKAGE